MVAQKRIGILALQGDVSLHERSLSGYAIKPIKVKTPDDLPRIDGLIIPGGESTALLKLATPIGLLAAITDFAQHGGSIFGTCAGAILLARRVTNPPQSSLGLLAITIERNGYGRQLDSTETNGQGSRALGVSTLPMTFIRAPRITDTGTSVSVLARYQQEPVLVRQGKILAATFHPELTNSTVVYDYWLGMFE